MKPPRIERKEIRARFKLTDYLRVESKHRGWNINSIKISLTENEDMTLTEAGQNGYSLVTEGDFDGRAGGNLVLYKDGKKVEPKKTFMVPGFTHTIMGFSID